MTTRFTCTVFSQYEAKINYERSKNKTNKSYFQQAMTTQCRSTLLKTVQTNQLEYTSKAVTILYNLVVLKTCYHGALLTF